MIIETCRLLAMLADDRANLVPRGYHSYTMFARCVAHRLVKLEPCFLCQCMGPAGIVVYRPDPSPKLWEKIDPVLFPNFQRGKIGQGMFRGMFCELGVKVGGRVFQQFYCRAAWGSCISCVAKDGKWRELTWFLPAKCMQYCVPPLERNLL